MSEAWDLSALASRLQHVTAGEGAGGAAVADILSEAAKIVGRKQPLSQAELYGIRDRILEVEGHVSVVSRVMGFMTFVNAMWLFAILGITISIGPSIYHVLAPLRKLIMHCWKWLLEKLIM